MNILILQGSPRANGNTAWMAEEYRKAAEAAGHKVTLVDVAHKKAVMLDMMHRETLSVARLIEEKSL